MIGNTAKKTEVRKNWVTPELKKIDIETITASNTKPKAGNYDGGSGINHS